MNGPDSSSVRAARGRVVVLMGPSGAGKTTVGREVARRLGWEFADADGFHSAEALRKMSSGVPLDDADREPWLARLREEIHARASGSDTVLACSALKDRYRRALAGDNPGDIEFVYLRAGRDVLEHRLAGRKEHFFRPELLASQLEALEEPQNALVVDASAPVDAVAGTIVAALESVRPAEKPA